MMLSLSRWISSASFSKHALQSSRNCRRDISISQISSKHVTQLHSSRSFPSPENIYKRLWTAHTRKWIVSAVYSHRAFSTSSRTERQKVQSRSYVDVDDPFNWRKWSEEAKALAVFVLGGSLFYVTNLERVPETGRVRFMFVPQKWEERLAAEEHEAFLEQFQGRILPPSHPIHQQVRRVVTAILEGNDLGSLRAPDQSSYIPPAAAQAKPQEGEEFWDPDATSSIATLTSEGGTQKTREWNLIVVDDNKMVNAAAGHGNIIVYTGILPVAQDEQGLAAVLSHEIAHVVARHTSEKMSSLVVVNVAIVFLEFLGLDGGIAGLIMEYLYSLPNSRVQELEADKIGLRLAARACFEPNAAPLLQTRLAQAERNSRLNVNFLYTHPTGEKRVKRLVDALPEAYEIRAASSACALMQENYDAFKDAVESIDGHH